MKGRIKEKLRKTAMLSPLINLICLVLDKAYLENLKKTMSL